jgi:hypothetical protein
LFFQPLTEPDFFVEPWKNLELRDCAEFQGGEVLFFVADEKLVAFLDAAKEGAYLFGAYNQITVCQMRARGTVLRGEVGSATEQLRNRLRVAIERRVDAEVDKLSGDEARARIAILEHGTPFRFRPTAYAYEVYTRG